MGIDWLTTPQLMHADVMHKRTLPRVHAFNYKVYYLALPIEHLKQGKFGILSFDRFNLLSFYQRDHGERDGTNAAQWARGLLQKFDNNDGVTHLVLVTLPRTLGYIFNPVSFWLGFNAKGDLLAAIAEVNNTFKETHSYVLSKQDGSFITSDDWMMTSKDFHVSPFLPVEGSYQFRFAVREAKLGIWIDHYNANGELTLLTSLIGNMEPMTRRALWKAFWAIPLVTLKVIGLIHFEAFRLLFKKIRYINKPSQKTHRVTHGHE